MNFAHWKNITGTGAELGRAGRFQVETQVLEHVIRDVPAGTSAADVAEKLFANGIRIGSTDGCGFEKEWSEDVRRQVSLLSDQSTNLSWSALR
jgi:hypothetical protein